MKYWVKRQIFVLVIILSMLLTACSQAEEVDPVQPVPTVDVDEIAAIVLSDLESRVEEQPTVEPTAPAEIEIDIDQIVDKVLIRLEELESQEEEPVNVAFSSEAAELAAEELQSSLIELYRLANQAVVFILVPPVGSGSGFVYSSDGYIVTNNHVVEGGRDYEVVFANGDRQRAELVGRDVDSDLAVIQVDELPEDITPLTLASAYELQVGQFVAAIGNPFGEQGSMSLGIVSGLGRSLRSQREGTIESSYSLPEVIQTDAPINPGNSGGPLLNLQGQVVGVNSAIATTTGTNSGVGFSIPVDAVKRIVPSLIENGSYDYPYMGAVFDDELSLDEAVEFGLSQTSGAYVISVTEDGPADLAGLIGAAPGTGRGGDLIVDIDGVAINNFGDLNGYLVFNTSVGQQIEITVLRGDDLVILSLILGQRP